MLWKSVRDAAAAAVNSKAYNSSGDSRALLSSAAVDPVRKTKVEVDIFWKTVSEDGKSLGLEARLLTGVLRRTSLWKWR